jgi:ketosteroid isomerase-like protein
MKTYRVTCFRTSALLIGAGVLLAACSRAVPAAVDSPSTSIPPYALAVDESNPLAVVNAFHTAVNRDDVDAVLALFADDAIVTDNRWVGERKGQIRTWALYSQGVTRLRLEMIDYQVNGEKVFWYDKAHNQPEAVYGSYILWWKAVIQKGKINSLTVSFLPMPDRK